MSDSGRQIGDPSEQQYAEDLERKIKSATKTFFVAYKTFKGVRIDNGYLTAGSPMYYFCSGCNCCVAVLEEAWFGVQKQPPRYCLNCRLLEEHGLLDALMVTAEAVQLLDTPPTSRQLIRD
jgi:hypothetical protein